MVTQKHQKIELQAVKREITGRKVKRLRNDGLIPAVLYGKDQEAISVQVQAKEFAKVAHEAGESSLVYLTVDGQTYPTLIHDIARNPLTDDYLHADFYKVNLKEKIKAMVPVVFTGEAPAVKNLGGIFVRNINELEVEALPADLPHEISFDISSLANFNDQITVKDAKLGADAKIVADENEIIAAIQEPISEEELKASLEEPTAAVEEVEEIKKEEKPAEDGEEEKVPTGTATPAEPAKPEKSGTPTT